MQKKNPVRRIQHLSNQTPKPHQKKPLKFKFYTIHTKNLSDQLINSLSKDLQFKIIDTLTKTQSNLLELNRFPPRTKTPN